MLKTGGCVALTPVTSASGVDGRFARQTAIARLLSTVSLVQCESNSSRCSVLCHAVQRSSEGPQSPVQDRRQLLSLSGCSVLAALISTAPITSPALAATDLISADIKPELAPNQADYDPTDEKLRDAASLLQQALNATDVQTEEQLFTELIEKYQAHDAKWVPDVVGRALGNRGNARSRQGKLDEAIADYNASIQLCPWSLDPVLNRGVVLEAQGRFDEAILDYKKVIGADAKDPSAWNNLGNASAGLQKWDDAAEYYGKAAELAPAFSFAAANRALAKYQLGERDESATNEALREMRNLLRRYPDFPDVRAALAAALWAMGDGGEAESQWLRVEDPRYRDRAWLAATRRWPPRLVANLTAFLDVQSTSKPAPAPAPQS